jgi:hypothetical protein
MESGGQMAYSSEHQQPTNDRSYRNRCHERKGDRDKSQNDQDYRHGNSPTACSL